MHYPLVSIIIPVYNVEKYLPKCIDSIITQTYKTIEIILVDDGSDDSSRQICDEYASVDSRIKVIHKDNGGVSSARNRGLDIATGEWVLFVDADDILPNDALDYYAEVVNKNDVDMVLGSYVKCNEVGTIIKSGNKIFQKQLSMLDCLKLFYKSDLFQGYVWNRLMKLSIIKENDLRYNESIYFKEDGLFAVQYMVCCSRPCYYSSKVVYNYYIHDTSSMRIYNSYFSYKYLSNLDARILCLKSIEKKYKNASLIFLAKYSVLHFYHNIKIRMREANIHNIKLRYSLLHKVGSGVGWLFLIKIKFASFKGYIYCLLREWKNRRNYYWRKIKK